MTVRAAVEDEHGRPVELTEERWAHIIDRHPELRELEKGVLQAVSSPDRLREGRRTNEAWCYLKTDAPSDWLKVVVAYAEGRGQIVTAFATRSTP